MEVQLTNSKEKITLADEIFACDFNEPLVHQIVTAYMAAGRAGTKAQKTRAEVSGGGIKPYKQKGTGQARAGTIRSPIWRKGGVTFAAKPRSFKQKVNRKMYQGALKSILSELVRLDRFKVIDQLEVTTYKTKALLSKLTELNLGRKVLIITDKMDDNLFLAARNLHYIEIKEVATVISNPVCFMKTEQVLILKSALKTLEGLLL